MPDFLFYGIKKGLKYLHFPISDRRKVDLISLTNSLT